VRDQLSLETLENTLPGYRRTDRDTARLAAVGVATRRDAQKLRVLQELAEAGDEGRTDYELGLVLQILRTSAGKRRKELLEHGLVRDSRRRRNTDTGTSAVVWELTDSGREIASLLKEQE
jgi:hypothetical protein